jgi:hypothetical protein
LKIEDIANGRLDVADGIAQQKGGHCGAADGHHLMRQGFENDLEMAAG